MADSFKPPDLNRNKECWNCSGFKVQTINVKRSQQAYHYKNDTQHSDQISLQLGCPKHILKNFFFPSTFSEDAQIAWDICRKIRSENIV